ncbi:MAG: RDD family protein [Rhizobiaceae bacterium]
MPDRYFVRRIFASIIDWLILGVLFAIIGLGIQTVFGIKVAAPGMIRATSCESQGVLSEARMDILLPVKKGEVQFQTVCSITHMGISTHRVVVLGRATEIDGIKYNHSVNYVIDENNQQITFFPVEILLYLFGPLLLALWISKFGSTIGKKWLDLFIFDKKGQKPTLKQALKREYLKGFVFAASAIYSIYEVFQLQNVEVEELVKMLPPLTKPFGETSPIYLIVIGVFLSVALFWFYFGSFIRWRGQAYWDRFAKLKVATHDDRFRLRNNV